MEAVKAVFRSWNTSRAITYRRMNDIPGTGNGSQCPDHGILAIKVQLRERVLHLQEIRQPVQRAFMGVFN